MSPIKLGKYEATYRLVSSIDASTVLMGTIETNTIALDGVRPFAIRLQFVVSAAAEFDPELQFPGVAWQSLGKFSVKQQAPSTT